MTFIVPNAVLTFEGQSVELNERQISHIAALVKDDLPKLNGYETTDGHKTVVALREISASMGKWVNQRMCVTPVIRKFTHNFADTTRLSGRAMEANLYSTFPDLAAGPEEAIVNVTITQIYVLVDKDTTVRVGARTPFEKGPAGRTYTYHTAGQFNDVDYFVNGNSDYERGTLQLGVSDNIAAVDIEVSFVKINNPVEIGAIRMDRSELEYLKQNPEARKQLLSLLGVPTKMGEFYRDTIVDEVEVSTNAPVETLTIDFEAYEATSGATGNVTLLKSVKSLILRKINSHEFVHIGDIADQPIAIINGPIDFTGSLNGDRNVLTYIRSQDVKTAEFDVVYYGPGIVDTGVTHVDTYRL